MSDTSPFDHQPDTELGAVLREALSAADDKAFARRVVAAAAPLWAGAPGADWWEVLYRWAQPGLAAALLGLIAGAVLWFGVLTAAGDAEFQLGDPLRSPQGRLGVPGLLAAPEEPQLDELLAVASGN